MRRSTTEPVVQYEFPLFTWCLCEKCRDEFKQEKGFVRVDLDNKKYVCGECCSTKEEAISFFKGQRGR